MTLPDRARALFACACVVAAASALPATIRAQVAGMLPGAMPISASGRVDTVAVDRVVRAQVDSGFVGMVLVASHDTALMYKGYGTAYRMRPTTAFWIGSMTKGFTAAAILALQEEGKLSVRDSLARFFPGAPADKRAITLHQLLTHTAGLPRRFAGAGIADRDSAVRAILALPLQSAPGATFAYVDDGYELLAAVVEVAAGTTWETYVERRLLRPSFLTSTAYWCMRRSGAPPTTVSAKGTRTPCPGASDWGHRGANGISSTAVDLLRWTDALAPGGALASIGRAMYTPHVFVRHEPPADVYYGYGVRIYQRDGRTTEVMHSGASDDDHTGIVRILPSGVRIVVLSNAGMHGETTWASYVASKLASR